MISLESLQALLVHNLGTPRRLHFLDVACALGAVYALFKVGQITRRRMRATTLRGPPTPSFLWGIEQVMQSASDAAVLYEQWAEEYGGMYEIPSALGGRRIVFSDPKAIAHFYANGESTYVLPPSHRIGAEQLLGNGLLTATGESHRRQRKTFTPAFSNAAIRSLTPVFYDAVYKAKSSWDSLIESSGGGSVVIDVQNWMKYISLDTIGIAGFSHDFHSLDGKRHTVAEVLNELSKKSDNTIFAPLALAIPWIMKLPSPFTKLIKELNNSMGAIANELLVKTRKEKEAGTLGQREEESMLGLLIKAEYQESQLHLSRDEVMAQAKVLLLAGYDTTSILLAWLLIDICQHPDVQNKLRSELLEFGADPTYDQVSNGLPYLDGVIHESLRMHPPHTITLRITSEDDVVPLSKPVYTRSGKLIDQVIINKGTTALVPIAAVNKSTAVWGSDAKEFKPERWIATDGIPAKAREVQGHRHLLTFTDGPRICPGKAFAIAELKMVLAVLVKNFVFELVDGPKTAIGMAPSLVPRPKVAGEEGDAIPLRVRRFE